METIRYQHWARFTKSNQPDRWYAQSSGTLEEILRILPVWCRTYPDHEIAILPTTSLPITRSDYIDLRWADSCGERMGQ